MRLRKATEVTSEINWELQGAEESSWAVFPVNSPNSFSANRSVVDSTYCKWSCFVLEKHSRNTWCRLTNQQKPIAKVTNQQKPFAKRTVGRALAWVSGFSFSRVGEGSNRQRKAWHKGFYCSFHLLIAWQALVYALANQNYLQLSCLLCTNVACIKDDNGGCF